MSTTDPRPKAAPLWPKLLVALVLLVAIGLALRPRFTRWQHARGAHSGAPTVRPAPPQVLAFLAPIAVGGTLDGAEVLAIHGVDHGLIRVDLRKNGKRLSLTIGRAERAYQGTRAGPYRVYIWQSEASPEVTATLAEALARSLRAHPDRTPPPGLPAETQER